MGRDWCHGRRFFAWGTKCTEKLGIAVTDGTRHDVDITVTRDERPYTRHDELGRYNKNDVLIMIPAISNLIEKAFEDKVDLLQHFSLASVAIEKRYASLYENFDVNANYNIDDHGKSIRTLLQ